MELTPLNQVFVGIFLLALILGAVANRTNFCTMGAVSDWVNMGDTGRIRAWFLAMAVAVIGVITMEQLGVLGLDGTRPPYRSPNFALPRYLLGGLMFGVGMTLASGCGNKNLVRIGGGNLKSILVVIVAGCFAYLMNKTDFYAILFYSWINPVTVDLSAMGFDGQDLGSLLGGVLGADPLMARTVIGLVLAALVLFLVFRSADFRASKENIAGGLVVGLCVLGVWYVTGGPAGLEALDEAEWLDEKPEALGVQSFTFITPMGESLNFIVEPSRILFTLGVTAVAGVVFGSFLYATTTRNFRIEWFANVGDFVRHLLGAALMGIGGVLGLGCTIGQGVTGVSTLALGSFVTLAAIVVGSAMTMKVQYYKMLYDDASVTDAFITGLVDLHLLPAGMRKLEAL